MILSKQYLRIILLIIGPFVLTNVGYCQSDEVYDAIYQDFNPMVMDYNPHFEYSLDKENKKMLWKDDEYNLVDEYGNEFNSKWLIDLANYDEGKMIMILLLQFRNKRAAKGYYSQTLQERTNSSTEVRLLGDGFDVAIITERVFRN